MGLCPRNAADYGQTLTEQQAEEWCNRVKGKQCNGIKCRWNKEKESTVDVKREQIEQGKLW